MQSIYCISCGQPSGYTYKKPVLCGHCGTAFDKSIKLATKANEPEPVTRPVQQRPSYQPQRRPAPTYNFVDDDEIEDIDPDRPLNLKRDDIEVQVEPIRRQTIGEVIQEEAQIQSSKPAARGRPKKNPPMAVRPPTSYKDLLDNAAKSTRYDISE